MKIQKKNNNLSNADVKILEEIKEKMDVLKSRVLLLKVTDKINFFKVKLEGKGNMFLISFNRSKNMAYIFDIEKFEKQHIKEVLYELDLQRLGFENEYITDILFFLFRKNIDLAVQFAKLVIGNRKIIQKAEGNIEEAKQLLDSNEIYSEISKVEDEEYIQYIKKHVGLDKLSMVNLSKLIKLIKHTEELDDFKEEALLCKEAEELLDRYKKIIDK